MSHSKFSSNGYASANLLQPRLCERLGESPRPKWFPFIKGVPSTKEIPFINSFNKPDSFKAQAKYSKIHLDSLLFSPYIKKTAVNRLNMVHRSLRLFFLSLLRLETTASFVRFIRGGAIVASNGFLSFVPQSSIKQKLKKVFSNYKVIKGKKRNCALSTSFKYNIILTDLKVKRAKKRDSLVRRKKSRFKKKSL